ncbi:MAG TPA: hypothetical protein VIT67_17535, partial [Povalibacter sp.]
MTAYGLGSTNPYAYGQQFVYGPPLHVVPDRAAQIRETYRTQGAAPALHELTVAQNDPALTQDQRKELLTTLRADVIDKVAADVGAKARKTDLPASGQSAASIQIDDQQEYQNVVTEL